MDSRPTKRGAGMIRRRRKCFSCAERFSTFEVREDLFDRLRGVDVEQLQVLLQNITEGAAVLSDLVGDG